MKKRAKIILSEDAQKTYDWLIFKSVTSKKEKMIYNFFSRKIKLISLNPNFGNPISKKLIPKFYQEKYDIKNLFRVELPCFWRLLYTVKRDEIEIIAFVVEIIEHKNYDKRFGYN